MMERKTAITLLQGLYKTELAVERDAVLGGEQVVIALERERVARLKCKS